MWSMAVWSLNNDVTSSLGLGPAPNFQNNPSLPQVAYQCNRMHPYAHPLHTKVLKHFLYIYMMRMWDAVYGGLEPQP